MLSVALAYRSPTRALQGDGFGVCCKFDDIRCGSTSSQNNTFLEPSDSEKSDVGECTYTICPCSTDVCRIRYEFTTLTLATQFQGTTATGAGAATDLTNKNAVGGCPTDSLQVINLGAGKSSPVICGTNTGQHMILDSDGSSCHEITISKSGTTSRDWAIAVFQYGGSVDKDNTPAGPPGCLQYFTGRTGTVSNFGSVANLASTTALTADTTHLANQDYSICFRRYGSCARNCYAPRAAGTASAADQDAFGLSASAMAASQSQVGSDCTTDYIQIPQGVESTIPAIGSPNTRFCGRYLNTSAEQTASVTVCSAILPFRIQVNFDAGEVASATTDASTDELSTFPGGIVGFRLAYTQQTSAGASCA